jgi:outer membrane PBP1 activator LpoA protein
MNNFSRNKGRVAAALLAFALSGCSTASGNPQVAGLGGTPSPPAAQDCAQISSGSPNQYRCGDQTYTSYDLTKMQRNNGAQQPSGK